MKAIATKHNESTSTAELNEVLAKIRYAANAGLYKLCVDCSSWTNKEAVEYVALVLDAMGFGAYVNATGTAIDFEWRY